MPEWPADQPPIFFECSLFEDQKKCAEVKDLAALEANEKKADALGQRLVGDDQKQMQGYRKRADSMGTRRARARRAEQTYS